MKDLSSSRGFSLLELLIYMAILSIMSVILSASFLSLTKGRAKSESRTEVNSNLRFAMERIVQDINAASAVSAPDPGAASSTLQLSLSGSTTTWRVITGQLQRTVGVNPADRITSTAVVASTNWPPGTRSGVWTQPGSNDSQRWSGV